MATNKYQHQSGRNGRHHQNKNNTQESIKSASAPTKELAEREVRREEWLERAVTMFSRNGMVNAEVASIIAQIASATSALDAVVDQLIQSAADQAMSRSVASASRIATIRKMGTTAVRKRDVRALLSTYHSPEKLLQWAKASRSREVEKASRFVLIGHLMLVCFHVVSIPAANRLKEPQRQPSTSA